MSKTDIYELKRSVDIVSVVSRYVPTLKKDGQHWVASCPFHSESSASFKVTPSKRFFKCFGCGKSGDVIDFLVYWGMSVSEAINSLQDPNNTAAITYAGTVQGSKSPAPIEWKAIEPRSPFIQPDATHYKLGKPSKIWYYRNANGHPIGLVCRYDLGDGKKEVLPLSFCRAETPSGIRTEWRFKGLEKPRPLYSLNLIKMRNEPILIGEGEKTADAMHALFIEYTATTWIGGVEGVKHVDFSPLAGRDVVLWPDNDKDKVYKNGPRAGQVMDFQDQPGNKAMLLIAEILKPIAKSVRWVRNPDWAPCGWDVADQESWTPSEAAKYLEANIIPVPELKPSTEQEQKQISRPAPPTVDRRDEASDYKKAAETVQQLPAAAELSKNDVEDLQEEKQAAAVIKIVHDQRNAPPPPEDPDDKKPAGIRGGGYFRMLGYQKDVNVNLYHFYSYKSKSVISLSPSAMTRPNLLQLAPLEWWEGYFPRYGKGGGFELDAAQDWLINESVSARIFNSKWIRGRGAWIDERKGPNGQIVKDVVIHAGEKLIVNGTPTDFDEYNSKYIYEIGEDMGFKPAEQLTTKQASVLLDILSLVNWEREVDAYLLAGWCVVAPMCGALNWRPHIWVTGGAGSGKSWIFEKLVRRLLGESGLSVQGETSEAGLRQMLKHDALPVVFDEAEGEDKKAQDRMSDVLSLMRSSSASDGGIMAKGTSGGRANTYRIRSCFAFASIAIQLTHQSDRTRVTILSLKKGDKSEERNQRWKQLQKKYHDTISEDYSDRLRARTIAMLPTILKNAETFSAAAAAELGQQRAGDQVGVLLAGAYSLRSSKEVSYKEALAWIQKRNWNEEKSQEQSRDELALIQHILGQITRIERPSGGVEERTIGELVRIAAGIIRDNIFDPHHAQDRLNRIGIKTVKASVVIGNSVDAINKFLVGTHWAKNYNKILVRLDGAEDCEPTRFASGMKVRATKIPLVTLFANEQGQLWEVGEEKTNPTTTDSTGAPVADIITKNPNDKDDKLPF